MTKIITCTNIGVFEGALTRGKKYVVFEDDRRKYQVRIQGDNGRHRWFPDYCFDMTGGPAPVLVRWKFDDPFDDGIDDWMEVSFYLDDGSRRWCIMTTPARLKEFVERPTNKP